MSTIAVDDATFDEAVPSDGIAVVDFWAPWCGPCVSYAPVFAASADENPEVVHLKVNIDECPELAERFEVRSIPTTMFLRERLVIGRIAGALGPARLADLISQTKVVDMEKVRSDPDNGPR